MQSGVICVVPLKPYKTMMNCLYGGKPQPANGICSPADIID